MSDLADFVLAYVRDRGGIVDPPVYGAYDVLLPESEAGRLGVRSLERWTFDEGTAEAAGDVTAIGYGHPLVERMVDATLAAPACARFYINAVRLDKRGLFKLAEQTLSLANARLHALPDAMEGRALFHYLQVNFKAALVTDEKREQLVSVWIDAQAGAAVPELAALRLPLAEAPEFGSLPVAPLAWLPEHGPTSPQALAALLERAAEAAVVPLAGAIARLQARGARHLELDRVRLEQYFDDIEADLTRRLQRTADESRRAALAAKLVSARAERDAKLADVTAKYRLRLELEPINVALIAQPKLRLAVQVKNRHAAVERTVVWDPLRHILQPLACDVCLRPDSRLSLCAGGHLVCADPACRAPQCVDCTRYYCRLCAAEMGACAVCARPICRHSTLRCADCGRGTCREHAGQCHAAEGKPRAKARPARKPVAGQTGPMDVEPIDVETTPPSDAAGRSGKAGKAKSLNQTDTEDKAGDKSRPSKPGRSGRTGKSGRAAAALPPRRVERPSYSALRLDVVIDEFRPLVAGEVFHPRSRVEVARRTWLLDEHGIVVRCLCEQEDACPMDGRIYRPPYAEQVTSLIKEMIEGLREEYAVAPRRIDYMLSTGSSITRELSALKLGPQWTDEATLASARDEFDRRYNAGRPRGRRG